MYNRNAVWQAKRMRALNIVIARQDAEISKLKEANDKMEHWIDAILRNTKTGNWTPEDAILILRDQFEKREGEKVELKEAGV